MKPLTLEETALKEEMKERCLAKGQYIDENAKAKFEMLCHLEDFEVQYWELKQENQELKKQAENYKKLGFKHLQDKNNNLETQQKEFINYLQEELNVQIQEESIGCEITNKRYILEEILQKYKSIIVGSDE